MSINPQNYLLALILWHLIFCRVLTLQASLLKGLWILAELRPLQQTGFPSEHVWTEFWAWFSGENSQQKITVLR